MCMPHAVCCSAVDRQSLPRAQDFLISEMLYTACNLPLFCASCQGGLHCMADLRILTNVLMP